MRFGPEQYDSVTEVLGYGLAENELMADLSWCSIAVRGSTAMGDLFTNLNWC